MIRSHAEDLELAQRCASGDPEAWDRFVLEYRPVLYRAADALDRHGGAREVADALYAELYGVRNTHGERQSLFRYFQGRSSLATWLRAVLAQRYVDRQRAQRRLAPLADTDADIGRGAVTGVGGGVARPRSVTRTIRRAAAQGARRGDRRARAAGAPAARLLLRPGADPRRNGPRDAGARGHRLTAAGAHAPRAFVRTSSGGSSRRG